MPYDKEKNICIKLVLNKKLHAELLKEAERMSLPLATYLKVIIGERTRREQV
jgi:hypothetical protein